MNAYYFLDISFPLEERMKGAMPSDRNRTKKFITIRQASYIGLSTFIIIDTNSMVGLRCSTNCSMFALISSS